MAYGPSPCNSCSSFDRLVPVMELMEQYPAGLLARSGAYVRLACFGGSEVGVSAIGPRRRGKAVSRPLTSKTPTR